MPFLDIAGGSEDVSRVELSKSSCIVGKKPGNDIVIDENAISRRHCEVFSDSTGYHIRDLGSRNGTYLNGKRISAATPLGDGALIQLGNCRITFHLGDSGTKPAVKGPDLTSLKTTIHERLLKEMDLKHQDYEQESDEQLHQRVQRAVKDLVKQLDGDIPSEVDRNNLVKEVLDEALGLGPLEDLLADDDVDEIMVNGWNNIYVEKKGKIEKTTKSFTNNQQVLSVIRRIIAPIGRRVDETSPMVDARLPDGSRINAIIPPLALTGPTLTIRKFSATPFQMKDLIAFNSLTKEMASFLQFAVMHRANICISGGTGSGKTSLLNVMAAAIPPTERIVTIEDSAELKLPQDHVVSLESKPPNIAGEGAIRIRDLVINSLRMRPDRIVIGECRGGEALDMLQAMNTGHDGSMTTLHANTPRDALRRLETLVLMAGMDLPARAIREQISSAINIIVQLSRMPDGTRKVTSIVEITGMEGDTILSQEIFSFKQTGYDAHHKVLGSFESTGMVPKVVQQLRERGVEYDLSVFSPTGKG